MVEQIKHWSPWNFLHHWRLGVLGVNNDTCIVGLYIVKLDNSSRIALIIYVPKIRGFNYYFT